MAHARNYSSALEQKRNIIGLNLQKYRQKEKLSKQDLSNQLIMLGVDIPAKSIYHIEAGTRSVVDFEICAIAKVLHIPTQYLLDDYYNSLGSA